MGGRKQLSGNGKRGRIVIRKEFDSQSMGSKSPRSSAPDWGTGILPPTLAKGHDLEVRIGRMM